MGKAREKQVRPGQVSILLPELLLKQLRELAEYTGCSTADIIRRGLSAWLRSADAQAMVKETEESERIREQISNLSRSTVSGQKSESEK